MKKILLMNSPVFSSGNGKTFDINPLPPIGMAYLSSSLKKEGYKVKILDVILEGWYNHKKIKDNVYYIGLEYNDIKKFIEDYSPDVVGISAMFSRQSSIYKNISKIIKNISKKIIVIMGGAHTTVDPYSVLNDENVDFILVGESDRTFPQLLNKIKNNDYKNIEGIGYKENEKLILVPKKTYVTDLDNLDFPDWDEAHLEKYFGLESSHGKRVKKRFAPIVTSRGCPYNCVFCSAKKVWSKKYRTRSPENVIKELVWLKNKYGIEEVLIEDDNFTLDAKRAEKIFDLMIEKNLNLTWDTPNGIAVWTLNKTLIEKMVKSGCRSINIAIESGNQYHLKHNIKKPVDLKKVEEIVKTIQKYNIDVSMCFVFGIPGETRDMIFDSYRYAGKSKVYNPFISIATPYFGTELYDICKKNNYFKEEISHDAFHIRSFFIETPQLSERGIKTIMVWGWLHLFVLKIFDYGILNFLKNKFKLCNN